MDYTVAAVDEAMRLLFLVAESPGLGVTELARRSGNTKARAYRLLATLEQRSLVRRHGEGATYYLGFGAHLLGNAARLQLDLVKAVQGPLENLVRDLDETAVVRVRDGLESICVARVESSQAVRVYGDVVRRRPLYAGASGKVLLAYAPAEVMQAVLASERVRRTDRTPIDAARLEADCRRVIARGYATTRGEWEPDVAAVAVPLYDFRSEVVAALGVTAPASRLGQDRLEAVLQALRRTADAISRSLGHGADRKDMPGREMPER